MELWSEIIVEWMNCLDVSETPIKDIKQLRSEKCYEKLINLLSWKNEDVSSKDNIVTQFLKDEYPDFNIESNDEEVDSNDIHIGSLLLLYVSQELVFHRPMCVKLRHETQIKIKTFLELVLPYGKNITRDIVCEALVELTDLTPKTPLPTLRKQSLKEFFNSPASRSAQSQQKLTEHNRALRRLRTELETERFEKADLQEDLEIQQKKVHSLQKKLQEKTVEIKLLREEQMRPATPQSCKKHKNIKHYEALCRREVDRLEHELLQHQCEMSKVEEEKESVSKKLASMERQYTVLQEKCSNFESSMESLLIQIEFKDRELIDLRMTTEELRAHLELKKNSAADQSCELESLLVPPSPKAGEVLSSVVDLQLQEVKKESDSLKAQLGSANEKLRCMVDNNDRLTEANSILQDDVRLMTEYVEENARLKEIAIQKCILEEDIDKLQHSSAAKDKCLLFLSASLENFETDIGTKMNDISNKLEKSAQRVQELEVSKNKLRKYYESKLDLISSETQNLKLEREKFIFDLQKINHSHELLREEASHVSIQIKSKDEEIQSLCSEIKCLKTECKHLASSVKEQELLKCLKETLETQLGSANVKLKCMVEDNDRLTEANSLLQADIRKMTEYMEENARLKEIAIQKCILEEDIDKLQHSSAAKDKCLLFLSASLENFETDIGTKMNDISNKLEKSAQRVQELEVSKNKLRKYYESKLDLISSETQNLKLEREKFIFDLQKINHSHELLREEASHVSIQIKSKDEEIQSLCSEIKCLKTECEHLASSVKEQELLKCLKETLETQLGSANVKLKCMVEDNDRFTEANSLLQADIRKMTEYMEENARLKEIAIQKCILEEDIDKLQHSSAAKDKCLLFLSASLENFETDIGTKMNDISNKLEKSAQRVQELEVSKNKLRKYYESKLDLISSETQNLKLEREKFIFDLQKINHSHELLREDASHVSIQIKSKDEEIQSLCSEIKCLKAECEHLDSSVKEQELLRCLKETLETQLGSANVKLKCVVEDNDRLTEANSLLQDDVRKMTEYMEENARLKEIAVQKCILEEDIVKLQHTSTAKDEFLLSLSVSLENFETDIGTKMKDISNKLEKSAQRVQELEVSKNELRKYYESKLDLISSETQNLKLERDKLLFDVQKINDSHELLREEASSISTQITSKDGEIQSLCSEIKCLKTECKHLASSVKEHEFLRCYKETLETQLGSANEKLRCMIEDNSHLTEANNILQDDVRRMTEYIEENARLKNIALQKDVLEENIVKLQQTVTAKDEYLSSLSALLQNFETDIHTKMGDISNKLDNSAERVKRLEVSKNGLQKYYESKIDVISSDVHNLKLDRQKLVLDLQKINDRHELLREEASDMSIQIKSKDEEIQSKSIQTSKNELKLQSQVDSLLKDKKELKEKLDMGRIRNTKLERNMDELRSELKQLKTEWETTTPLLTEIVNLKQEVIRLKDENVSLSKKNEDSCKRFNDEDFANRLKEVHAMYEQKLEEKKQKMKVAYNEQVAKMNKAQALAVQINNDDLRTQMEQQCLKHTEEIHRYKLHVGDLNKQFWHTAEKLLAEQQQKQQVLLQLNELKVKFQGLQLDVTQTQTTAPKQQKCFKLEKTDFVTEDIFHGNIRTLKVTQEETHERRHSVRSIQAMGNAFKTADEEGEVFDNTYLSDMKEGFCLPTHDMDRLSVLQQRNSLYLPHLKSSYPAELQFYPSSLNEEDIKTGSTSDDMFNDSLSQSLLPEQKLKKKDRTQTSYKKPGPPTPSKNGGRLSLQGSGHRSPGSRILKERNSDRRTTTTPRVFKHMFNIKRQDENISGTPKRRLSNIFRKTRATERQQKL